MSYPGGKPPGPLTAPPRTIVHPWPDAIPSPYEKNINPTASVSAAFLRFSIRPKFWTVPRSFRDPRFRKIGTPPTRPTAPGPGPGVEREKSNFQCFFNSPLLRLKTFLGRILADPGSGLFYCHCFIAKRRLWNSSNHFVLSENCLVTGTIVITGQGPIAWV